MASLKALEAQGHDHELLHVDVVVGVGAAVEDVHHRRRHDAGADPAQVAVQRQPAVIGRRMGGGQRDAQDGVGAQLLLVFAAVQGDHAGVHGGLIEGVHAAQLVGQLAVDVVDGLDDPRPRYLDLSPSRSSRASWMPVLAPLGTAARPNGAVGQFDVDFDGGVAAAVEDLPGVDVYDGGAHVSNVPC